MAAVKTPMTAAGFRAAADALFRAWNDHDVEAILERLTDDVAWIDPSLDEPARGKEAVAAHLKDMFSSFTDLHLLTEDFHLFPNADEAAIVSTWTLTGTMTGAFQETGIPATGKHVKISGTNINRFRDGLISEYVIVYDALDFLQQLGALPRSDALGFKALVLADVLLGKATDQAMKVLHR